MKTNPNEPLGPCLVCGAPAAEQHHIIPRGHIGGRLAENWPLNLAPLCKKCHTRWHVEGPSRACGVDTPEAARALLWNRKGYSTVELQALWALLWRLKPGMYPLVAERAEWARGELARRSRRGAVGDMLAAEKLWAAAVVDGEWAPLLKQVAGPIPGWVGLD